MALALGSGECSVRLSAPSTAWRIFCSSLFLISSTTALTTIARRFLGPLGNLAAQRHERADELDVRLHAPEHLRLEQELLEPAAFDGVLLDDGDDVLLEVVADVAEPFGQPRATTCPDRPSAGRPLRRHRSRRRWRPGPRPSRRRRRRASSRRRTCSPGAPANPCPGPDASAGVVRAREGMKSSLAPLQVVKIKIVQILQRLLFLFRQRLLERLAGLIAAGTPDLAQVLADVALFLRAEVAEGAAQEDQRPLELVVVQRADVGGQFLPERLAGQQRVAIALGQPLEPAGAEVGRDARRQPPRDLARQILVGDQAALQQRGAGVAGQERVAIVGVGEAS